MKTALLHYWITNIRGGEKVLAQLAKIFPQADIFTHAFIAKNAGKIFNGHRICESLISKLPLGRRHPQAYLPLMPFATRHLKLDKYDLIISSESGPIKGIKKRPGQKHYCYCHTPMRYVWDMSDDYYRSAGPLGKLGMKLFLDYLKKEDLKSADSVDHFIANSKFVANRIKRIYNRDSTVIHPPVDIDFFSSVRRSEDSSSEPYYLFAGANVAYKRLDLAVAACKKMNRRLIVAGGGRVTDEKLRELYANAKALIFPGIEDFGIVPVEAQAAGTPVIAFGEGGALETVVENETGLFFNEQTVDSLCAAIEEFESRTWSERSCRDNATNFSHAAFTNAISALIG